MTLDRNVVEERLRLIQEVLDDLDAIGEITEERLENDRIVRHAVERVITQRVDLSVSINGHIVAASKGETPATYRKSYAAAAEVGAISTEVAPSAGLRNILTHDYVGIDLGLLIAALPPFTSAYRRYVTEIARFLAT